MRDFHRLFILFVIALGLSVCVGLAEANPADDENLSDVRNDDLLSIADRNYTLLQHALPLYEKAAANPWPMLPSQTVLKPGMNHSAVFALRNHLKATGDLLAENDHATSNYDRDLAKAVKHFQQRHGLYPDGVIGRDTFYELNIPAETRLRQIQVNIQRWAKLAAEFTDHYILVNIPAYRLDLVQNNQLILSMRAVVGKPQRPTPEIYSTVTRIVFNPYWNIPKSIADADIVPKMLRNRHYLQSMHIRIFDQQVDDAGELNADDVDWQAARDEGLQYHLRQEPGQDNALGLVKFEFKNSDDIYMHDTPAKNLFDLDKRAFSSGCIRLEKPFLLVSYLMKDDPSWTETKFEDILGTGKTRYMKVSTPTPVIITYLTTWVDEVGNLQFRDDIYGLDSPIY